MRDEQLRARIVRCPTCGGDSVYALSNPSRPFCSARCKNADFGAWATEAYGIQGEPSEKEDEQEGPGPA